MKDVKNYDSFNKTFINILRGEDIEQTSQLYKSTRNVFVFV